MKSIVGFFAAVLTVVSLSVFADPVHVVLETTKGEIVIEVYEDKAPKTSAYFLDLIDSGTYSGATFYRSSTLGVENGPSLIQGGIMLDAITGANPKISEVTAEPPKILPEVESTSQTGIKHQRGVVSFARDLFNTGFVVPEIFICEGDFPSLDEGAPDKPDTKGFPAFAKVVEGMEVIEAISSGETAGKTEIEILKGQILTEPVVITKAYRK